jgi:hypothetical protein
MGKNTESVEITYVDYSVARNSLSVIDDWAIYRKVEEMRRAAGPSIVRSLEATVRQTIEAHSSDSDTFKPGSTNYFRHVGRGRWALR